MKEMNKRNRSLILTERERDRERKKEPTFGNWYKMDLDMCVSDLLAE